MGKRRFVCFVLATMLAGTSVVAFLWWTAPRINESAFAEIEHGMSRVDVEKILNCPGRKWHRLTAGNGKEPTIIIEWLETSRVPEHGKYRHYAWLTDEMMILVQFDADDRVLEKSVHAGSFDAGILARIRRAIRSSFW